MNYLDVKVIHKLEREFDKSGDGLSITQFVEAMIAHAALIPPDASKEKELEIVSLLREMFNQIDVDGDGTMDWEELTAFNVQSGLMATATEEGNVGDDTPEPVQIRIERADWFLDNSKHGKGVTSD